MLRKLKIKFVSIIMFIITVMFLAILTFVMYSTQKNLERQSIQMMQSLEFRPMQQMPVNPPEEIPDHIRLPFFTITIQTDGEIEASGSEYYDLTDKEFLNTLIESVSRQDEPTGVLPDYHLRYLKTERNHLQKIIFSDMTSEKVMLKSLLRNSLLIGLIGYILFFGISLILAEWVTKPVRKAWNEQKQFIADASHELKTPLTVIMTNAEMLEDSRYHDSEKRNFTKNILSMSKRMRGLVEDLLELARIDNGTELTSVETLDYSRLLTDSILPFEPLFYEKDLKIISNIEPGIQVQGDKIKLEQVINILLDNAMKYSDADFPVMITLHSHGAHCVVSVSGRGKSLSKSECKKIFERFYRVNTARNDTQSYGLGLSIADSIIKEHHGKIWAESEKGQNTFYVWLAKK